MGDIIRKPERAVKEHYDLLIIGGGIYGVMLLYEATRRHLQALMIEKDDFGGATSYNSLRIIHGGLRYLQSMDIVRFRESVKERAWFLNSFPGLVKPLPCLMPLYNRGLKRPFIFRVALMANDILSSNALPEGFSNEDLPPGIVINSWETKCIFNQVDPRGLRGGAVWYDAMMPYPSRIIMELLRWSCSMGGVAINYMEAVKLINQEGRTWGVQALDHIRGDRYEFKADNVINAAGPWSREIAEKFDLERPSLYRKSVAWNILFNREAISNHAVAVSSKAGRGHVYFLIPWNGKLFAGTGHAMCDRSLPQPVPEEKDIKTFINDINRSVRGLRLKEDDILHVYSGFLPVTEEGGTKLTKRPVFVDHGKEGGTHGFYSLSGIKFTTARLEAERAVNAIFGNEKSGRARRMFAKAPGDVGNIKRGVFDFNWWPSPSDDSWKEELTRLIEEESPMHLDDLVYRRTNLGDNPNRMVKVGPEICSLFGWDETRSIKELGRLKV